MGDKETGALTSEHGQYGNTGAKYGATQYWGLDLTDLADGNSMSIQFMLPEKPTQNLLFGFWLATGKSGGPHIQYNMSAPQVTNAAYTITLVDAEGKLATSIEADVVYTLTLTLTDATDTITGNWLSYMNSADTKVMYVAK